MSKAYDMHMEGMTVEDIAGELGIKQASVERSIQREKKRIREASWDETNGGKCFDVYEEVEKPQPQQKHEITKTSIRESVISGEYKGSGPLSEKEMFNIFELDKKEWKVDKKIVNSWGNKFQHKLWLSRIENSLESKTLLNMLENWDRKGKKFNTKIKPVKKKSERLLYLNISDVHIDKPCYSEISDDNYGIEVACKLYREAIEYFLSTAKRSEYDKILFIYGGDLMNSDGATGTTTKGTPAEIETNWKIAYERSFELLIECIEMCSAQAPVEVLHIEGNHSRSNDYTFSVAINAWFRKDQNVNSIQHKKDSYAYTFGNTLIVSDHGVKKDTDYINTTPILFKEQWSKARYTYVFLQHFHKSKMTQQMVNDEFGVEVRRLPSFCGTDNWHRRNSYVGAKKRAIAHVFDKITGMYDTIEFSPDPENYK